MKDARRTIARSSAPWPRWSTGQAKWRASGKAGSTTSKIYSKGWTNERTRDQNAFRHCGTRNFFSAGKDLARADAAAPDRGVAHEERFQACRGPPFQSSRRLGRCRLSGPGSRAEQSAVLHLGGLWSRECGDLDSHTDEHRDPPAHGAVGLPAGSAAGLPGRQIRVAAVLCKPGAGLGAGRLKPLPGVEGPANASLLSPPASSLIRLGERRYSGRML